MAITIKTYFFFSSQRKSLRIGISSQFPVNCHQEKQFCVAGKQLITQLTSFQKSSSGQD